jgi:hypothetical protein
VTRVSKFEHVQIDEEVKKLLLRGIEKAGSGKKLAEIMGYSTPTNIIWQFTTAPKHKKYILKSRLQRLSNFVYVCMHDK